MCLINFAVSFMFLYYVLHWLHWLRYSLIAQWHYYLFTTMEKLERSLKALFKERGFAKLI